MGELKARGHEAYRLHTTVARPWGAYTVLQERPRLQDQAHRGEARRRAVAAAPSPAQRALGRRRTAPRTSRAATRPIAVGAQRIRRTSRSRRSIGWRIPASDAARDDRSPVRRLPRRGRHRPLRGPLRARAGVAQAGMSGSICALEARDLILEQQLAALHPRELQLIVRRILGQAMDHVVEIAMLELQRDQAAASARPGPHCRCQSIAARGHALRSPFNRFRPAPAAGRRPSRLVIQMPVRISAMPATWNRATTRSPRKSQASTTPNTGIRWTKSPATLAPTCSTPRFQKM